ncbi:methionine adenosyltransferase sam2 [Puccinia graminis f. sp. tritici]|uniref:Methionine adenosyltransferase sam2 n=1 Tax=Puccinia graminis f. sp. tritici TaxID=56615 RepID=A0A5B0NBU7_PUCGR|nr:methionine adenosyltransferase sam2 [Puccinia graminis f. sp. tritici]
MFGYAADETAELMPLTLVLAHRLNAKLAEERRKKRGDPTGSVRTQRLKSRSSTRRRRIPAQSRRSESTPSSFPPSMPKRSPPKTSEKPSCKRLSSKSSLAICLTTKPSTTSNLPGAS